MSLRWLLVASLVACGGSPPPVAPVKPAADVDPDGPNRALVTAQVQPLIDGELATGVVVGVIEGSRREIYGFGKGPDGKPPTGKTLFEVGAVTKIFTGLLLADAVQRREVELDTPVAELLPTGVTVPVRDQHVITLRHLALHSSGLPPLPPSVPPDVANPFGGYDENRLYADLVHAQLVAAPGERIIYSDFASGLLGHALGRKAGSGFKAAVSTRLLGPLGLHDTFFTVPADAKARVAVGTDEDLAPAKPWTFDALAGAGGLVSSAHDLLALLDAELDAQAGGKGPLRRAMALTQEAQLENAGENEGLGWQIDSAGRYWHNGSTGGYHAFVGFDPKTRRGLVILASTKTSLVDSIAANIYHALAGEQVKPPTFPDAAELATYAGTYELQGTKLQLTVSGKRLYVEGPGEPKIRLVPISDKEFWMERFNSIVLFERDGDTIKRAIFVIGQNQISAKRIN